MQETENLQVQSMHEQGIERLGINLELPWQLPLLPEGPALV